MDDENPSPGFVFSDQILRGSSVTECFQSNVISSKEENPVIGTMESENLSSGFVKPDQTLIRPLAINESECSKPLVDSTHVECRKIDDNKSRKTETLGLSVQKEDEESEGGQIKKFLDDSLKDESEDSLFSKTPAELSDLSPVSPERNDETGLLDTEGTLHCVEDQLCFRNSGEDGSSQEVLRLSPGPWSEGCVKNHRNCIRCSYIEEERLRRNSRREWPSLKFYLNMDPRRRRHYAQRNHNFRREREIEMYGCSDYLGRDSEPEPCPVGAGLANLGNTCFLNAIMQCFTHTVPLVQGLMSVKHWKSSHDADEFCVLCAVCEHIKYSLLYSGQVMSPSYLVDNLSYISSDFRRYQQEDAHEFLQCLLGKLDSNWLDYESSVNDFSWPYDTPVKQIFGGRLVSQVCCCSCGHNSETFEPLIDLSLEIEDADSIKSALKSFTKVESIEKFTCDSCKEQVKVEKQLMLDKAPAVAALHLKRFKSDGIYVEKIVKMVDFPLELDLSPYTKGLSGRNEDLKYRLFAVVVHVGISSNSGHYFCFISTSPGRWYQFDDSKVTRVDEEEVLCANAYILFYAKNDTPWFDSMIENWKAECHKILNTSKSVVDDMGLPSTSYSAKTDLHGDDLIETRDVGVEVQNRPRVVTGLHGCEAAEKTDTMGNASVAPVNDMLQTPVANHGGVDAVANQTSVSSLRAPTNDTLEVKKDSFNLDASLMEEEYLSQANTCTEQVNTFDGEPKKEVPITTTPPRDTSPDIYSDAEPAEEVYSIPTNHLKMKEKGSSSSSGKKSANTMKQEMKRKEAAKYISRAMPGSRRQLLLAAISGTDSLLSNKKRGKQSSNCPKKRLKVSPKRHLKPLTA